MNSGPCKGQFAVVTIAAAPSALANVIMESRVIARVAIGETKP